MFKYFYLLIHCLLISQMAHAKNIYISKDGVDIAQGTVDRPLATLNGARNWIRKYKLSTEYQDNKSNIVVYIRAGNYSLASSFVLDEHDSAEDGFSITYEAYQNEKVRFTGGVEFDAELLEVVNDIGALEKLPKNSRNYVKSLHLNEVDHLSVFNWNRVEPRKIGSEPELISPEELFVDNVPMTLARWPNNAWAKTSIASYSFRKYQKKQRDVFYFDNERINKWDEDTWLFGFWNWDWFDQAIQIKKIDYTSKVISLKNKHYYGIGENKRFYVFNTLSELDQEGEYYIDRSNNTLYYWPISGKNNIVLSLSILDKPLIVLNNLSNVIFNKITLDQGRSSGISVNNSRNITVSNSIIKNIGNTGVFISGGHNVSIINSEIFNTGTRGVYVSGGNRENLLSSNHRVTNNHIHHYGRRIYSHSHGVEIQGVGQIISNNVISHAPHMGIRFYGNDHIIENNQIHNVCLETSDAGAIYTGRDWSARGTIIRNNFIYDLKGLDSEGDVMGVYLDDFASGIYIHGNVFSKIHRGVLVGGGRDNYIQGNVFYKNNIPISIDSRGRGWAKSHLKEGGQLRTSLNKVPYKTSLWVSRYPKLSMILSNEPDIPKGNVISTNYMLSSGDININQLAIHYSDINNNLILNNNPGFVNPEMGDFSIIKNSSADLFLENWIK